MNDIFKKIPGLLIILFFCTEIETYGQRFYSVVFSQLPRDMQLYARDDNNMAEVPISGYIEIPGWTHFSVVFSIYVRSLGAWPLTFRQQASLRLMEIIFSISEKRS